MAAADGKGAFLDELARLPGGGTVRGEIEQRLATDGASGICREYALHFGALVENLEPGMVPPPEKRRINAFLKSEGP
jgi:adenylosuccinate lyase